MSNRSIPHTNPGSPDPAGIPHQLHGCRRWVMWVYEERGGKRTKVPKHPNGKSARVNDPSTWCDYRTARRALGTGRFAGVGVVLGDGLVGLDLDWKGYPGEGIPLEAQAILSRFASYAEMSPSGKGAHVLLLGHLPAGARNRTRLAEGVDLEVYGGGRFFTVTGERLNNYDVTDQQAELEALLAELGMLPAPAPAPRYPAPPPQPVELSDAELLERMFGSKSGAEIGRLWAGDWSGYPSQSEADLALASHLLWWTNGDVARADRLFRRSGLYREKWDRPHFADGRTYGQATLERALSSFRGGYESRTPATGGVVFMSHGGQPQPARPLQTSEELPPPRHQLDGLAGKEEVSPGVPRYVVRDGVIHVARVDGRGEPRIVTYSRLANFAAIIRREIHATDGVEQTTLFEIEGYLSDGRELPTIRVPASKFTKMDWPIEGWGAKARILPGRGVADNLRDAIQDLSMGHTVEATLYKHLGWTKIDDRWVYLHGGGGIAADGSVSVEVATGNSTLDGFRLPDPPTADTEQERIGQLIDLLYLAPPRVVIPMLLYTLGAPLGHAPFSIYMAGPSGARKTSMAVVFQSLFGHKGGAPVGWEATANALESMAFAAKDTLLLIDDYAPAGSQRAQQDLEAKAARLLRNQGNGVGRLRMRSDGSTAGDRPPRGSLLITGEDLPPGHSIRARTLIIDIQHDDILPGTLREAQELARKGVYAEGMAAWIKYLAADLEKHMERLERRTIELRAEWASAPHGRTTDALARLQSVWEIFRDYAATRGVDLSFMDNIVTEALRYYVETQADAIRDADPVVQFTNLLHSALRMGRAHIEPVDLHKGGDLTEYMRDPSVWGWKYNKLAGVWEPQGPRIGWIPRDGAARGLYLDPTPTWTVTNGLAMANAQKLPTERELWKRLAERNLIYTEEDGNKTRLKTRVMVRGQVFRVLHLKPQYAPAGEDADDYGGSANDDR